MRLPDCFRLYGVSSVFLILDMRGQFPWGAAWKHELFPPITIGGKMIIAYRNHRTSYFQKENTSEIARHWPHTQGQMRVIILLKHFTLSCKCPCQIIAVWDNGFFGFFLSGSYCGVSHILLYLQLFFKWIGVNSPNLNL